LSTKKVIAIVVVTNLIIIAFLLASLSTAGVVMAFPPGPEGLVTPEEMVEIQGINTKKPTIPYANYDSGWVSIEKGANKRIAHKLGGKVDDYLVNLMCKDPGEDGINQNYYGVDSGYGGVTWWGLTNWDIRIYRDKKDTYCDKVRLRIWKTGAPIYEGP
jgi:hypothetical protein